MNQHLKAVSVKKPETGNMICEDASKRTRDCIVVSDGAGGGGIFADRWAQYLVDNLPETAIGTFQEFAEWMEQIWNPFYIEYEKVAQEQGGMLLNKFYDEGSFATLVAAWRTGSKVRWMAYGDSVVFHYNRKTKALAHSFTSISDFSKPPYLLNWKDEALEEGFASGEFDVSEPSYVFACSDALSHYIMMMYAVANGEEIPIAEDKNGNIIALARRMRVDFEKDVLKPMFNALRTDSLPAHCRSKYWKGLLAIDDYSLARLV